MSYFLDQIRLSQEIKKNLYRLWVRRKYLTWVSGASIPAGVLRPKVLG